jgi:hypothetical protein
MRARLWGRHYSDPLGQIEPADLANVHQLASRYRQALKVDLKDIVQNGYDAQARRFTCEGSLSVLSPTGQALSVVTAYETQSLAGEDGKFLVRIAQGGAMAAELRKDFVGYVSANKVELHFRGEAGGQVGGREACIAERVAETERQFQARENARSAEAEAAHEEFRPTPIPALEEFQANARAQAESACK